MSSRVQKLRVGVEQGNRDMFIRYKKMSLQINYLFSSLEAKFSITVFVEAKLLYNQ